MNKVTMKKFTTEEIRDLLNRVMREEISFSRMVEVINERVVDVREPKFKKGDKVRIKKGISSKTHQHILPCFTIGMDDLIGKGLTVDGCVNGVVFIKESGFPFHEDWLEPYVEELKRGDLAIFLDSDKEGAFIGEYDYFIGDVPYPHQHHRGGVWANAIKFESKEQYEKLLKGEI